MKRIITKAMLSATLVLLFVSALAGCARRPAEAEKTGTDQESERNQPEQGVKALDMIPGTPLSTEELTRFNDIFAAQADTNHFLPVNGFFTSRYDDVTELDFAEFLRYYPDDGTLEEEDVSEFEALTKDPNFHWNAGDFGKETLTVNDLPTPTHRILRTSVDETLQKYAGITTADLKNTEGVCYLSEYDAYYNFTSDFGPGLFECAGGKKDGNIVHLWSSADSDGSGELLTLQEKDGNYYIKSFQDIADGE